MKTDFRAKVAQFLDNYGIYNDPEIGDVCIACRRAKKYVKAEGFYNWDYVIQHAENCELVDLLNAARSDAED